MDYMVSRLGALPGVTLYGGHGRRCGAVSFTIDGASSYDVGMILDKQGIAVRTGTHCAQPVMAHYGIDGTVRASLALYTTTEEIDRFIEGLSRATGILR
jgi:cysteine desulfurase/selenocysteine lyase